MFSRNHFLFGYFVIGTARQSRHILKNPSNLSSTLRPAGGMDTFTRTAAHILEKSGIVNQKIRVTNRRGGGATVAINYVMDQKGDPYVLQHWTTSPLDYVITRYHQGKKLERPDHYRHA